MLAKGHFVCGELEESLRLLDNSDLQSVNWSGGLSRRVKKILAEGFALKGKIASRHRHFHRGGVTRFK